MKLTVILAATLLSFPALAWIIPARTIVQKTVENHGNALYQIEQEVVLESESHRIPVKETWTVQDDSTMRVNVQSLKDSPVSFSLQFIYNDNQRMQLQTSGKTGKSIELEFLERPLHFRTSEGFAHFLKLNKSAPDGILVAPALPAKTSDIKHGSESFVRYGRSGGVVNYVFGTATPVDSTTDNPGVWIEQDAFVVRKIRYPSGATMEASDFVSYPKGLWFPKNRIVTWGPEKQFKATIKTKNVEVRKSTPPNFFKAAGLDFTNDFAPLNADTEYAFVTEFYMRFR